MISTGELRKGVVIELDGDLWQILDYHHIKMGRGSAQVRIKLRNVKKGSTVERSFQAGDRWPRAQIDRRPVQFLYREGDDFHFMDTDTYDQFTLSANQLDDAALYVKDGMTLDRTSYQGETLGVELPVTVDLRVTETEPGFAGDTAQGARKSATLETGLVVSVPLFVSAGDVVRADTRTGEYQTRLCRTMARSRRGSRRHRGGARPDGRGVPRAGHRGVEREPVLAREPRIGAARGVARAPGWCDPLDRVDRDARRLDEDHVRRVRVRRRQAAVVLTRGRAVA